MGDVVSARLLPKRCTPGVCARGADRWHSPTVAAVRVDRLAVSVIMGGLPKRRRRPILYGCGWWLVGGLMDGLSIRLRPVIVDRMDGRYPVVARHMLVALRRRRPVLTRWWLAAVIMGGLPKRRHRPILYGWWLCHWYFIFIVTLFPSRKWKGHRRPCIARRWIIHL